ncbi:MULTISPECIES: phosphatidylserine decarboxylase family protein [Pelosinus]|uniref:Phosphatidylserine decarboxylase proenzyme n=1 Tax=Pelosinus fermentans B4 TaxID=1149862 RepID=I8RFG4_9FIRM|nr:MULTISPECIES: phosphatidylserine decarboxylase family protein [Pelosinus]EIW18263.1 phosphatidylserine decarboxylase related protein [Pelosinus fermentans B4]EIW24249.1 Phosphatidylserine decarboxylase proenzyme [Pelosinus fermentans A11]OAM94307.1 Phosphatidylserine decarboxylase proenzyme [Pelosinus fermentans DSM 17108]SDR05709.1 phosphatidylserine decarboxylase [Pelosinus fermentans]
MVKAPIVKEGYIFIVILAIITILVYVTVNPYWSIIPVVLMGFITFFFRNPKRSIPNDDRLILSPADGKVMSVCEVYDDQFLNQVGLKVTIFLSVFDVHLNRSPIAGEIKFQQYTCGRFRPAYKKTVGCENERHSIGIENDEMKVLVTQIAGILARRIVSWVTLGSILQKGERYGMIKFASCTEIIVPKTVEIVVKKGDKVKGGETVIGRLLQ